MSLPVVLRPDAETDLAEATRWYERQQSGLGERFVGQVSAALDRVSEGPGMYDLIWEDVRSYRLHGFPYLIYYRILPDHIEVLAVLHGARDPATWRDRT